MSDLDPIGRPPRPDRGRGHGTRGMGLRRVSPGPPCLTTPARETALHDSAPLVTTYDLVPANVTAGHPTCGSPVSVTVRNLIAAGVTAGHPRVGARRPHFCGDSQAWAEHQRARKAKNQADKRSRGRRRVVVKVGRRSRTFEWRDILITLGINPRFHFFPDDVADAFLDEIETKIFRHR